LMTCLRMVCMFECDLVVFCFFFQAEDGIRDRDGWLEFNVCSSDLGGPVSGCGPSLHLGAAGGSGI